MRQLTKKGNNSVTSLLLVVGIVALVAIFSIFTFFSNGMFKNSLVGDARAHGIVNQKVTQKFHSDTCTDQCAVDETGCAGTRRWYCGENDADECRDKIFVDCSYGCDEGACNAAPESPDEDSTCGGHAQGPCDGSNPCDTDLQLCEGDNKCWLCCGDGTLNGECGMWNPEYGVACSGNPLLGSLGYDGDCTAACPQSFGQTGSFYIHQVIEEAGDLYENYDDQQFFQLIKTYWEQSGNKQWGHGWLSGYGIYSLGRVALQYKSELSPPTKALFTCMVEDAANYPTVYQCGGKGDSCTEEAIDKAMRYATAAAWHKTHQYDTEVKDAISLAFSKTTSTTGKIYLLEEDDQTKMYNHGSENPVYAVAMMGHVHQIRKMYEVAGITPPQLDSTTNQNIEDLYAWVQTKISNEEFKQRECMSADGNEQCFCTDERIEEPDHSFYCGGLKRSTKDYPLALFLDEQGITNTEPFPDQGCNEGQKKYNWVSNCLFT